MLDYTGVKCPVCGVPFRQGDDIVVCPECGAPYHRACYQEKGQCVFQDLHQQGKEWQAPAPPKAPDPRAEIKDQECPVCGTLNAHSALFCNRCGASLTGAPDQVHAPRGGSSEGPWGQNPPPSSGWGMPRGGFAGPAPFSADPMGGVSPAETLEPGVTYGDASRLVKQNTAYYMPVFRYMKTTGKNKFNFTAFLFSGGWMLYRKQYRNGAIVTALIFVLYLGYLCSNIFVATPVMLDLLEQAGIDSTQALTPASEQMLALSQRLLEEPVLYFYMLLPLLFLVAILGVMLFVGIRGNKMYLRHCVATARKVKAAGNDGDPNNTLDARGGVNPSIAICLFVCYLIVVNLPLWIL